VYNKWNYESFDSFHTINKCKSTEYTLKELEMVEDILSRNKPPANVPKIPQTIVMPPNNKSALLYKEKAGQRSTFPQRTQVQYVTQIMFIL